MEKNSSNQVVVSQFKGLPSDKTNNASGQESKHFSTTESVVSAPSTTAVGSSYVQNSAKSKSVPNSRDKNEKRSSGRNSYKSHNTKNSQYGGAVARPEIGSVSRPGSRKGNAVCDFVQFTYDGGRSSRCNVTGSGYADDPSRFNSRANNYSRHFNSTSSRNRFYSTSHGPSYNKEQYLQATCQFVVLDGFNCNAHLADADLIVDWDHIEELRVSVEEIPSCPICLYPPIAAKITRCGHVFCWTCILHYLALSDKSWRKCPICYESIYKNQLKSVVASTVNRLEIGKEMTMVLMRREKGSNVILPVMEAGQQQRHIKPVDGTNVQFSKLLSITRGQVMSLIVERERSELGIKMAEDELEPEACFIHEALASLQEREISLRSEMTKSKHEKPLSSGSPPISTGFSGFSSQAAEVETFIDAFNDEKRSGGSVRSAQSAPAAVSSSGRASGTFNVGFQSGLPEETEVDVEGIETLAAAANNAAAMNDKAYYFYQAQDGQQVYLHPINARCLMHQYGSLASSPEYITGQIVDMETFVMTEELRRRFRYLSHLPLTTTFMLAELKLSGDVLAEETISHFSYEFAKREEGRQRKAKEEKRQQTQAERWERAVMLDPRNASKYVTSNASALEIPVSKFVPSAQRDIEAGVGISNSAVSASDQSANMATGTAASSLLGEPSSSPPSFAQMLRQGKPKPTPPQPPLTQVGNPTHANQSTNFDASELDEEQREFLHLHTFQDAFGDALQSALDNYKNDMAAAATADDGTASIANKKKKKKMKGRLLFST